jgi:hypothetical protein
VASSEKTEEELRKRHVVPLVLKLLSSLFVPQEAHFRQLELSAEEAILFSYK